MPKDIEALREALRGPLEELLRILAAGLARSEPQEIMCLRDTPAPAAVRKLIKTGELPASKLGREVVFKRADYLTLIERKRIMPAKKTAAPAPANDSKDAVLARALPNRVRRRA